MKRGMRLNGSCWTPQPSSRGLWKAETVKWRYTRGCRSSAGAAPSGRTIGDMVQCSAVQGCTSSRPELISLPAAAQVYTDVPAQIGTKPGTAQICEAVSLAVSNRLPDQ